MAAEPLTDSHGRRVSDLRISVTDRCNFRCQYCMPAEGLDWIERSGILTYEEIERLVGILGSIGIDAVRLTGGEPLVRRELPELIGRIKGLGTIRDLALTTNGYLLERHAEALAGAGLDRINVSIDSLERDRFFRLTRRDALPQVLAGLEAVMAQPGIGSVKVNAVAIRGFTEVELHRFCDLARTSGCQVRFIEFMPLDGDRSWDPSQVLTGAELRVLIEEFHPLVEVERDLPVVEQLLQRPSGLLGFDRFLDEDGLALLGLDLAQPARVGSLDMHIGERPALFQRRRKAVTALGGLQLLRRRRRVVDADRLAVGLARV